jgi:hypothetical protein
MSAYLEQRLALKHSRFLDKIPLLANVRSQSVLFYSPQAEDAQKVCIYGHVAGDQPYRV